jgi:hypothetical protein
MLTRQYVKWLMVPESQFNAHFVGEALAHLGPRRLSVTGAAAVESYQHGTEMATIARSCSKCFKRDVMGPEATEGPPSIYTLTAGFGALEYCSASVAQLAEFKLRLHYIPRAWYKERNSSHTFDHWAVG